MFHSERASGATALPQGLRPETGKGRRVIVASNRGPVEFRRSDDGELLATRGGGGVAMALSALGRYLDFTWVACAMGDGDRFAAAGAGYRTLVTSLDDQRFSSLGREHNACWESNPIVGVNHIE